MARILVVHGIGNTFSGEMELRGHWHRALSDGLLRVGHQPLPPEEDCYCPFYGDVFRPGAPLGTGREPTVDDLDESDDQRMLVDAVWRAAAETDPDVPRPEEYGETLFRSPRFIERALNSLARSKFLTDLVPLQFLGDLEQVVHYLNDAGTRARILNRVFPHLGAETKVMIGHSLGSVVAYEALCAQPVQGVTFVSLGSPLGIRNVVFDKLTPPPSAKGRGFWPSGVSAWINVAARGDIVAAQKELSALFGARVTDVLIDSGWHAHDSARYLNAAQTGAAIARALTQ